MVSSDDKIELVRELGAKAVIDRRDFALTDPDTGERNFDEVKRFGKAVREAAGGVDCDIVFEHVGAATFSTSVFVCKTFGKIVICGATSGFHARLRRALPVDAPEVDHRQPLRQRLRVRARQPADRRGQDRAGAVASVFPFSECPVPHQMMKQNQHVGKMVVLVGAEREGEGRSA